MFVWAVFKQYFPYQFRGYIEKYSQRLLSFVYPYIQITFNEFTGERLNHPSHVFKFSFRNRFYLCLSVPNSKFPEN
ncbi:hypothetical protein ERO13_D10G214901v2 [Gossypium hirsutum]|uniref:AAA-type ATPase N-terminal domain-containing protein n=4 Tax=Gossypium TaxID=3633 RepID=A0A5J5PVE6_GOSBA|nr:hypothetical protein ES319_D10G241500v1 [Gossypium barbadense]KAG4127424.1 hypothetical protein ERO13_D10G214901v2 [Gossypium hirsutum]TYG51479.1 hypothetical protein ES288_D10G261000v1 [Gossypium darwinii]TYH51279.1 hypothetical protein ES332_D10G262100v1 [Gossypium tomentosum]TYI62466.1 hypothetical protein E1A91_D10G246200v1 [Gossypium mustelinum]